MKKMKWLFFGAGVLGSLYAARLQEAGEDVTVLDRGERYHSIREQGIVLQHFVTGEIHQIPVNVIDRMPADDFFDVCVVMVQKNHVPSALEALKTNPHIPTFLFMHNTAEGTQDLEEALGRERVMMGHANAGGELKDQRVLYMASQKMTLGELDGHTSQRLRDIALVFEKAGFPVEISHHIDAWKRYHVALAVPFALAMYRNKACNFGLSHNRKDSRLCLQGIREAFRVLRHLGYPVEPKKLGTVLRLPDFILAPLFRRMLRTEIADIGMARHLRNAREEMQLLADEFDRLIKKAGLETPVLDELRS